MVYLSFTLEALVLVWFFSFIVVLLWLEVVLDRIVDAIVVVVIVLSINFLVVFKSSSLVTIVV